jgi:flavin-dependent dehydrogenase
VTFDAITVGGGLAGSTLATALARAGRKVLVLERETEFKDRVRPREHAALGGAPIGAG